MTTAENKPSRSPGLLGSSAIMAAGTVVSRLTGFGRSAIIAAALGLAVTADVFNVANVVPNMLYVLVGGGVLNSVLVPALVRAIKNDADGGQAYSQRLYSLAVTVLGIATVLSVLAAPWLMRLVVDSSFLEPDMRPFFDNMVMFARFCLPQIFFYGLYVLVGQMLNAKGRFGPMMWAPILNNIVSIAVFAGYLLAFGAKEEEPFDTIEMVVLGVGSTLGVAIQALCLVPVLRSTGFSLRFRTDWKGHGLAEPVKLGLWTFGFVALNQVAYLFFVNVATGASAINEGTSDAGYTVYANAMLIMMVPHSVITVSLATALLPRLSDLAADGKLDDVRRKISAAIRTCLAIIVPIAALMGTLAPHVAAALFNYGAAEGRTGAVALTLVALLPGLVGFTIHYLALRGFYAVQDTRTPFFNQIWVASAMVIWALGMTVIAVGPSMVTVVLATGYSVAYVVGATVGLLQLQRRIGSLRIPRMVRHLFKVTVPAGVAGAIAYLLSEGMTQLGVEDALPNLVAQLLILAVGGLVGLAVFVGLAYAMRINEVRRAVAMIASKVLKRQVTVPEEDETQHAMRPVPAVEELHPADTGTLSIFRRPTLDPEMTAEFFLDETMPGVPGFWDTATSNAAVPAIAAAPVIPATPPAPSLGDTLATSQRPTMGPDGGSLGDQVSRVDVDTEPDLPPEARRAVSTPINGAGHTVAGRYLIEELLDDTDGVRSFRAVDAVLRREVFVQTVAPHDPRSSAFAAAARAASTVADPRFLRVLDIGVDGQAYVVREWIPGGSVADLLATGALAADRTASIGREVAEAMASAHAQGLAHRHLDPTLVFVGTDGAVKIAGLETEAALHGPFAFTDEDDGRPVTEPAAVDAHCIGSVLYACLTARWPGGVAGSLPPAPRIDGRLASPRQVRPGVPRALDIITDRAIGHARRHHAPPLSTPAAVAAELAAGTPSRRQFAEYDTDSKPIVDPPALLDEPVGTNAAPRVPVAAPPPRRRRSGRMARILGVIGSALLLVGATMVGLQLLLGAIDDAGNDNDNGEPSPDDTASVSSPPPTTELAAFGIVGGIDFDPAGNEEENPNDVGLAFDGDPETSWQTVTYYDPLEAQKDGVGLVLDLGEDRAVREIRLQLVGGGSDIDLRVAPEGAGAHPAELDGWTSVGTLQETEANAVHTLAEPATTRYVLVWFTRLPADGGDFRGGIAEAEVVG